MPRTDIDWANLGFGFSDVNCHIRYVWKNGSWGKAEIVKDPYITMHIGAQAFFNIMVACNAFPNTGISLPFFSYGGTALAVQLAEMGILLSISRQARMKK